jgi:hypothetical protein
MDAGVPLKLNKDYIRIQWKFLRTDFLGTGGGGGIDRAACCPSIDANAD